MLRQTKTTAAVALMAITICFLTTAQDQKGRPPEGQARQASTRQIFDGLQPVDIHGKVIDQEGNAVAGVQLKIEWESASFLIGSPDPGQVSWVTSDGFGLWEFHIEKPHRVFVEDARKSGYEYVYTRESARNLVADKTAGKDQVIVHVRKKDDTTFLIVRPGGNRKSERLIRVLSPHSGTSDLDLLKEEGDKSPAGGYADLHVAVDYGLATGRWRIAYSVTNGTDGIAISNDHLYQAPQEGYQKEVVLNGPPWPRYLYLRSRTPTIYSRLDLEHVLWKESATTTGFRISYKAWTNPYGERNLEYESDLGDQYQLREQLEREAKTDLLQGKLPLKPDLAKLIKDAKAKAGKDMGKQ